LEHTSPPGNVLIPIRQAFRDKPILTLLVNTIYYALNLPLFSRFLLLSLLFLPRAPLELLTILTTQNECFRPKVSPKLHKVTPEYREYLRNIMRSTAFTLLVLSSLALAAPLRTDEVDHDVARIDTPKDIHQNCDMKNPQCSEYPTSLPIPGQSGSSEIAAFHRPISYASELTANRVCRSTE
jgi:hypothetical protein